ncbi:MAG: ribosome hibernation-promoting factor, HPF/YfiA family [Candidatus Magasanikbacteria bacterium]
MRIEIKTDKLELTDSLREFIKKKISSVEKFIQRFEDQEEAEVIVEVSRTTRHHKKGDDIYYAEANFHVKGNMIRAEHKSESPRSAIDGMKDTLKRELIEFKEKMVENKKKGGRPDKQ